MKKASLLLSGLLLSAVVSGPAAAEIVRMRVTARVTTVNDPSSYLAGKVVVGQRLTGTYVYNTNTPNVSPDPQYVGEYHPYANEARLRFAVGSLVFESKQPTQGIDILIFAQPMGGTGQFMMTSRDNKPLVDGTQVTDIQMQVQGNGNLTESAALPTAVPVFRTYQTKRVIISANSPVGFYSIAADLEAAERIVPDALVVAPASGTFAANQHFDAALILPRNSVVSNAHAMANGTPLPLSYPGSCQLQPQVGTGRPSLLCPAADSVLSILPGAPIEWTVELTNGTVFTETVNWERAP
jgi:hypothetical protein